MKIIATVKRVTDYEARLKITEDSKFIETRDVNMITNPFDEIGVEAALQIKEKFGGEVIAVSAGPEDSKQNIRTALAMGADRGILIVNESVDKFIDANYTSKILEHVIKQENPDIIIMGKQSIDTDNHQVAEILAENLGMANASQAYSIKVDSEKKIITVTKEFDGGLQTVETTMPCLITTDLRLNEPRYASLPGIMKAKRKKIETLNLSDLKLEVKNHVQMVKLETQPARKEVCMLNDLDELLDKLKTEVKVL